MTDTTELTLAAKKRRTFAIISHPDAGKTTLTEKLLLFGGAIQMAGTVKARKSGKYATSDWLDIEKQRGISVASSVMQFSYGDCVINLLDTPGHSDFSEDTYRVLTAVDAAVMVIDAANGVEAQTIKLLEVCRLRNTPIITFVNKLDREVRDPIELLDEIESVLKIHCAPITWPTWSRATSRCWPSASATDCASSTCGALPSARRRLARFPRPPCIRFRSSRPWCRSWRTCWRRAAASPRPTPWP